ncbi:hypothetical protein R3W88_004693 [Solanum pinnatisectum]|uniref:Uncharacterized protein n=1 Tax=Solanum pinnatisectum TaxID=50273 RepID=A0AAV9KCF7_9SOLN|nr:hypothetical protein R3W88_004693 [Solanum pinnatisectum]
MTEDLFATRYADCHFDEFEYPTLGEKHKQLENEIDWNAISLSHLDPQTNQYAFTNLSRITKSHVPTANAPVLVDIPIEQTVNANESRPRLKYGRLIGSKDKNPRKRKDDHNMKASAQGEPQDITNDETTENVELSENNKNKEISISCVSIGKRLNRNDVVVDNIFAYNVATEIMQ